MRLLLSTIVCSAVLVSSNAFAEPAAPARAGGARIRPQDQRSISVLREGMARSETFRRLVETIEAGNVFVYVHVSPLMKSSLAGKLTWMTQAGPYRYLRATLSTDLTNDLTIATLAHELQHAVEVVSDALVVDEKSLASLYKRIGHPSRAAASSGWETIAAQEAGFQVRRELVESNASIVAQLSDLDHM